MDKLACSRLQPVKETKNSTIIALILEKKLAVSSS